MESVLKSVLKRQLPYLIGGTITGIIVTYYYGFLFSIIVNSAIWFAISTIVNKYYWHYTGFKDEMALASKYIINRKKRKVKDQKDIANFKFQFSKKIISFSWLMLTKYLFYLCIYQRFSKIFIVRH